MKKYFFLATVSFISLSAFSNTIVIYNRNTSGSGPNGYDYVKATGVSVGNVTVISIQCSAEGSATCPTTVPTSVPGFTEQFDVCEIGYINDMIHYVNLQLASDNIEGNYKVNFYNIDNNQRYQYTATWFVNGSGEQVTQISKFVQ
jgi:hypothetical protein